MTLSKNYLWEGGLNTTTSFRLQDKSLSRFFLGGFIFLEYHNNLFFCHKNKKT